MAAKQSPAYERCTQMRRVELTHGTFFVATGEFIPERKEWVTRECGAPLFDKRRLSGICYSCERGWSAPNNYPVTSDALDGPVNSG